MRALTLKPHWAHAVAHLGKRIENRSIPIPPNLIGERVAIHAGATLPKGWPLDLLPFMDFTSTRTLAVGDGLQTHIAHGCWGSHFPQTRAIVATAVLSICKPGNHIRGLPWGDPSAKWWWGLGDVITLDEPIPWKRGQLGLWHIDRREGGAEVVERLREVT